MNYKSILWAAFVAALFNSNAALAQNGQEPDFRRWALTPPRGWNSWDCYYSSVNEQITMQNAAYMKEHLLDYGWEYVVVDIRWYCNHPSLGAGTYNQKGTQDYVLDEYGRYLPSPIRFPSAMVNGKNQGFKAMADAIHAMGMKFGIHIMRGVPTTVVQNPTKYSLKGADCSTDAKKRNIWAQVCNGTSSPCTWLKDNALVRNNSYGQLYYNSIIDLYAEWGVDFIKVDDMSRPFYSDEIQMIRNAIDQCGRPIVLSLSPGKTQYEYADECLRTANQWRMMDDLWDNWNHVSAVFNVAHAWEKVTRPGNFADCDMLPLGQIAMTVGDSGYTGAQSGRWTNLTKDEQYTMMTLWGICHSPLFFGGEMTKNDDFTNSLLTNRDMLDMNAYGVDAHEVRNDGTGNIVWTSLDPKDGTRYLAMFKDDDTRWVFDNEALYKSETVAYTTDGHAVDIDIPWNSSNKTLALVIDDGGDNYNYDHADWIEPTLILSDGTKVNLTGKYLTRTYTASYFNKVTENRNVANGGKMTVMGKTYERGFSTDANAMLLFAIPDDLDVVRFTAKAAADDSGIGQEGSTTSLVFMVFDKNPLTSERDNSLARSGLISRQGQKSCTLEADITDAAKLKIVVSNYGDGFSYDRADLINPVLIDKDGNETSLTTLTYSSYTSDWGTMRINRNVEGGTLRVDGKSYNTGIGMNAACTLTYDLPDSHNFTRFKALCGYDSSCDNDNTSTTGTTMEFLIYADADETQNVSLTQFGYDDAQQVEVYDIWAGKQLTSVKAADGISAKVPSHGAKLYRLSPVRTEGSSITLAIDSQTDEEAVITATVSGEYDADNSWVQFYCDGKPVGSVKYEGEPVSYYVKGFADGKHTFTARYSGSAKQYGATSNEVSINLATAVKSASATHSLMPVRFYSLEGRPLNAPAPGINIVKMSDGSSRKIFAMQ
jgi:hypothetical protein